MFLMEYVGEDIFKAPASMALAHCVSEEFDTDDRTAVAFKQRYCGEEALRGQKVAVGGCATLYHVERTLYYLVIKRAAHHFPMIGDLTRSIKALKRKCRKDKNFLLGIPKSGFGTDRLTWDCVAAILMKEFSDTDVELYVYE